MNKKIKIIDLLNKIANGEEVPSNIKVEDKEYCLDGSTYYTVGEDDEDLFCLESYTNTLDFLKSEVEILEEIEEIGEFVDLIGMDENEEEKKAIEIIKFLQHKCMQENGIGMMTIYRVDEIANAIETILNLIENQQEKISLLKDQLEYVKSEYEETIEHQQKEIEELKKNYIRLQNTDIYIKKDKIKAKIENFKKVRDTILENEAEYKRPMMTYDLIRNDYCEKMLQELLEEE